MPGDNPVAAPPIGQVVADSGIPYPNGTPYTHISFAIVVWNDATRLDRLLAHVRSTFKNIYVVVQRSEDATLSVAREWADVVVEDEHRGFGDASFGPKLLPLVATPWTLKLDADEWPSDDLLGSLSSATWHAEHARTKGIWIPFRSSVDGLEYEEQHAHLRLFHTAIGWPALLHSRPPIQDGVLWGQGYIRHDRSLDELVRDYLRYLDIGQGNAGWTSHNTMMIQSAVRSTAEKKGWGYVKDYEWWPRVSELMA